jgi:hypothetical protein
MIKHYRLVAATLFFVLPTVAVAAVSVSWPSCQPARRHASFAIGAQEIDRDRWASICGPLWGEGRYLSYGDTSIAFHDMESPTIRQTALCSIDIHEGTDAIHQLSVHLSTLGAAIHGVPDVLTLLRAHVPERLWPTLEIVAASVETNQDHQPLRAYGFDVTGGHEISALSHRWHMQITAR